METQVGNYRILKIIGEGFNAECYMGVHDETGESVCVKRIKKTDKNVEETLNEIAILKQIDHPYIVKFIDSIETQTHFFIIQELCNGRELLDVINDSDFISEYSIKKIFHQLMQAVEYLHENDISHGDIKPENVLCDHHFNIKLIDFGFANQASKKLDVFLGTLEYAAPEILSGISYIGGISDMWSCGVCLYVLFFMELPFQGETKQELRKKIKEVRFSIPEPISFEVEAIIRNLLTLDTSSRMTAKEVLGSSWFEEKDAQITFDFLEEISDDLDYSMEMFY
jgi:serine/threonine protein kinase